MSQSRATERFRDFPARRERWTIHGQTFDLTWPADMDALLDAPETQHRYNADGYMPYWAQPWPSAILLAEAVLAGPAGGAREAIEIGCGVGLVSLAAARAGWRVTATDYDPDAVAFAALNAERNGVTLAGCESLDYRRVLDEPRYDLVLGSDLLYERRLCEPVARWLGSALRPGGIALLSDPNRSAAEPFVELAVACGLNLITRPAETTAPAGLLHRGRILELTRRAPEAIGG